MNKLKELKEKIENIESSYDYDNYYTELRNIVIDYQNETQDWDFEYIFDDYVDEEILKQIVEYKIDKEGLWSVINLLSNIDRYTGIYYIDAYGYGHDIDKNDLDNIKEQILDEINRKLEEE